MATWNRIDFSRFVKCWKEKNFEHREDNPEEQNRLDSMANDEPFRIIDSQTNFKWSIPYATFWY